MFTESIVFSIKIVFNLNNFFYYGKEVFLTVQKQGFMIVTFVHVFVAEDHIQDFIRATIENHKESVKEPGNLRFDILRDAADPAKFVLYEAYESEEASAAHKNTRHYLAGAIRSPDGWLSQGRVLNIPLFILQILQNGE